MFNVNEQVQIGVFINDKELILNNGNALMVCHIHASSKTSLPVLRLELLDVLNKVAELGLSDNSKIRVSLKTSAVVDRDFRVFKWQRTPYGDGHAYMIDAYFDYPKYITGTSNGVFRGTSYGAIAKAAQDCGIKLHKNTKDTADSSLWMLGNKTNAAFCKYAAQHGRLSDTSHMALAVDSEGFLRYFDISALPEPKTTLAYLVSGENMVMLSDFKPSSAAGFNNHSAGFRHERVVQSLTKPSVLKDLSFTSDSNKPLLNMEVRDVVGRNKVSYSPINFGNTEEVQDKARYQNLRYNMLKSLGGEFVTPRPTGLEPLDNFKFSAPKELKLDGYNGTYTIADKIIFIAGSDYYEKLVAYRNGLDK